MKTIPVLNIQQFEQEVPLSDFYCNDLKAHLKKNEGLFNIPHRHNFFLCVLFSKGSGIHEIDFNTYEVKVGSVFFLKPGQTHYWKFDNLPEGYIFFHTQDFYELSFSKNKLEQFPFYYSHKNSPALTLTPNQLLLLEPIFRNIYEESYKKQSYKKQRILSFINIAYIDLSRYYVTFKSAKKSSSLTYIKTLRQLEKTIEIHYKTEKSATFYATQLNITSKHLNRIIQATLGKTTTDLITERVLLESKRLIVHSDNSLSAIAEILGYDDYAYFSKVFKSKTDSTPLEFKKSYDNF